MKGIECYLVFCGLSNETTFRRQLEASGMPPLAILVGKELFGFAIPIYRTDIEALKVASLQTRLQGIRKGWIDTNLGNSEIKSMDLLEPDDYAFSFSASESLYFTTNIAVKLNHLNRYVALDRLICSGEDEPLLAPHEWADLFQGWKDLGRRINPVYLESLGDHWEVGKSDVARRILAVLKKPLLITDRESLLMIGSALPTPVLDSDMADYPVERAIAILNSEPGLPYIEIDPDLTDEQVELAIGAIADMYRNLGGVGIRLRTDLQEVGIGEAVRV